MKLGTCLVAAFLIAATMSAALAAPGLVRNTVTLRAGPGNGFPVVGRIPAGAHVDIHGCISGGAWCDVTFSGERGWVAAMSLAYLDDDRYVYLPDYIDDVPIVPFALSSYWGSYYVGRPWYHRHAYWNRYWHRHPPVVAHGPRPPRGDFAGRPRPHVGPGPGVISPGVIGRGPQPHQPPGGLVHGGRGPGGMIATGHPPGPRVGVRPPAAAPHIARSPMIRPGGGPSVGVRAQMGGPRGPIGGVPRVGGAPHIGGGGHIGGGAGPRGGGGPRGGPGHPH